MSYNHDNALIYTAWMHAMHAENLPLMYGSIEVLFSFRMLLCRLRVTCSLYPSLLWPMGRRRSRGSRSRSCCRGGLKICVLCWQIRKTNIGWITMRLGSTLRPNGLCFIFWVIYILFFLFFVYSLFLFISYSLIWFNISLFLISFICFFFTGCIFIFILTFTIFALFYSLLYICFYSLQLL